MEKITLQEIATIIENNIEVQENIIAMQHELPGITERYSTDYSLIITKIANTAKTPHALLFVCNTCLFGHTASFYSYSKDRDIWKSILQTHKLGYLNDKLGSQAIWPLLPEAIAKPLISTAEANLLIKKRLDGKFDTESKSLKLDTFSFKLFEKYILSGKKLSGKDATRYLDKLPSTYAERDLTETQITLKYRYMTLIWDNAKVKSKQLSNSIIDSHMYAKASSKLPFAIVNSEIKSKPAEWNNEVTFSVHFFVYHANKFYIPNTLHSNGITESQLYRYITGIPRKFAMHVIDIHYALFKINVLTRLIVEDTLQCPYYQQALTQIIAELKDSKNIATFKQLADTCENSVIAERNALDILNHIKNTPKEKDSE